jgi:hypothetical protein
MKQTLVIACIVLSLLGCNAKKRSPDVSGIKVALQVERFEKDFFAVDTLHLNASLQALNNAHPGFTQDFLFNIMGTTPDSAKKDVPAFVRTYQSLYAASLQKYSNFTPIEEKVKKGLQFVHFYFPAYKLPGKLITFIGPINSYGNIITANALAVGLQLYMGREYPLYLSEMAQQLYPLYVSRRFEPAYIPVNCMKNIIDDMYPNNSMGRPLVEQMVESGKRMFVLDRLLPDAPDSIKTGYTQKQLEECYENEKNIWSFFVQNDLLYKADPNLTRDYMNDGPNTAALGEASPGNIGQFIGMQIVAKWMEKNKDLPLDVLMKAPPRQIFEEAKYKPK